MPGPQSTERSLDRVLVRAGLCSRTQARAAIEGGRIAVDGVVVTEPDTWIDVERAAVTVDGEPLRPRERAVWMLHKPVGFVTARIDHRGRPVACDLMPRSIGWLAPVGRLDLDTSGLLLFTNDGQLARAILDPHSGCEKRYEVECTGPLHDADLARLCEGVDLGDGKGDTRRARAEFARRGERDCAIRLWIHEGRNRQVRRMVRSLGVGVAHLHRASIGPLELAELPSGSARALRPEEELALRTSLGSALTPPANGAS